MAAAFDHPTTSQSQPHLKGLLLSPFPFFVRSHFSPLSPLPSPLPTLTTQSEEESTSAAPANTPLQTGRVATSTTP